VLNLNPWWSETLCASSPSPMPLCAASTTALLAPKVWTLEFADSGVQRLAEVAFEVNERTENIGAPALAHRDGAIARKRGPSMRASHGSRVLINREYNVEGNLGELVKDQDLSRYIL